MYSTNYAIISVNHIIIFIKILQNNDDILIGLEIFNQNLY